MSPRTRIKVAVQRPASWRKISASACSSAIHHLHGAERDGALAGQGALAGPLEGDVEVGSYDNPEAAHLVLALGESAVGHRHPADGGAQDGGDRRRTDAVAGHPSAGATESVVWGTRATERGERADERNHT